MNDGSVIETEVGSHDLLLIEEEELCGTRDLSLVQELRSARSLLPEQGVGPR